MLENKTHELLYKRTSPLEAKRINDVRLNYTFFDNTDNLIDEVKGYTFTDKTELFVLRNLVPAIANKLAGILYSYDPARVIEPKSLKSIIESVYEDNPTLFFDLEKAVVIGGSGVVRLQPVIDGTGAYTGHIDTVTYRADQIELQFTSEYPCELSAVGIFYTQKVYNKSSMLVMEIAEIWENDNIYYFKREASKGKNWAFTGSDTNVFGFLPFVVDNFEQPDMGKGFSNTPITQAVRLNKILIQKLTDLNFIHAFNCFANPVIKGSESKSLANQTYDPRKFLCIPENHDVSLLARDGKILENLAFVGEIEKEIYDCSEVPEIAIRGDSQKGYSSGKALMVQLSPLRNLFDRRARRQEAFEKELAKMIVKIDSFSKGEVTPTVLEKYNVNFSERNVYPVNPYTVGELTEQIKLGILSPVDLIRAEDPDLTEEEALARWRDNLDLYKQIMAASVASDLMQTEDTTEDTIVEEG